MKCSWRTNKVGDIFTLKQGLQISSKLRIPHSSDGYIPLLKIKDLPTKEFSEYVTDIPERYISKIDDIIYTRTGQVGDVYTNVIGCIHNNCFIIDYDRTEYDHKFLYYLFKNNRMKKLSNSIASGSVQKDLTHKLFNQIEVSIPNIENQIRIGNKLWLLDAKIELNNRLIDTLEEMASTLFKRWFVDFEFPDENGNPYKSSGGKMIDSELGEIPEGWEISSLGKIMDIKSGKRPKNKTSEKSIKSDIPIVGASKIMGYTSEVLINESIITTGRVGTHGVIQRFREPVWVSDNSFIIKSKFEGFVYEILKNIDYRSLNRGSTQPLITQTDLKEEVIVYPSRKLLVNFESIYQNNYQMIFELTAQNVNLESVRDTLLPKLLSGEIEF
ncbi:restriction endonuclease subunit S [Vagococcus fluvialis]|uniref:restriction endonuclease subunit S n=1 Tax=Vagococcus fluvialis TaxID=2738 RepID=UPI0022E0B734|nr:restriction endonuclease subunit S [Vagococcus fluvialis]